MWKAEALQPWWWSSRPAMHSQADSGPFMGSLRCLNRALSSLLSTPMALDKSQLEKALNAGSVNKSSHESTSQNLTLTPFLLRVLNHTFVPVLKSLLSDSWCPKYQPVSACRALPVICAEQCSAFCGLPHPVLSKACHNHHHNHLHPIRREHRNYDVLLRRKDAHV